MMFTQNQIRQQFIDFFKSKQHSYVPGCSLIPPNDPTLLFINSGMAQFKDVFLDLTNPKNVRVCNSQKCIRLSGKHNDLEEVGYDTYHHTFFEMLGNWSFGDYYKKEAITWAWELLTKIWKLPKNKLYATVYTTDDEAFNLWQQVTDIIPHHILRFGDKDNFWEMAEVGPCGPCSEIHIDMGENYCTCEGEKKETCQKEGGGVNQDCPRYIEIWNLVFIQYNRSTDGSLLPLEKVHVDTGMGFERICTVLQKKQSNYETDVFSPLIEYLEKLSGKKYNTDTQKSNDLNQVAFRVVVDHIRTISFSIADGIIPSNEGRGYVIRRVLRRAYRYGRELGFSEPFLYRFIDILDEHFGEFFKEIREQKILIKTIIQKEEKMFDLTLSRGLELFKKKTHDLSGNIIPGEVAFELYDTYGFPYDLTLLLASEKGLIIEKDKFTSLLDQQRKHSKQGRKISDKWDLIHLFKGENLDTIYTGDTLSSEEGILKKIIVNESNKDHFTATEQKKERIILVFDRTCLYAESGGQVGDNGIIENEKGTKFKVEDVQKIEKIFLIYGKLINGNLKVGSRYQQRYDLVRRNAIRKNHTATHIMHQALRKELGDHIRQAGSLVNDQKLRFDFNHFEEISQKKIQKIEQKVNEIIDKNLAVTAETMPIKKALDLGAKAFFEEKYGEIVRILTIGTQNNPPFSLELCGGSHVTYTGEIGGFKITQESSSSSGIRRIEAITGPSLVKDYLIKNQILKETMETLKIDNENQILTVYQKLKNEVETLKKQLVSYTHSNLDQKINYEVIKTPSGKIHFYLTQLSKEDNKVLSEKIDQIKNRDPAGLILLINESAPDQFVFLMGLGTKLLETLHAGELIKKMANQCGGRGGGKPSFAQGGGTQSEKIPQAIEMLKQEIQL